MKLFWKRKNSREGFTIMEMLVAMVILAVAASIMFNVMANSAKQQGYLEDRTFALILADNKLNEIYAAKPADINTTPEKVEMAGRPWLVTTKLARENNFLTRIDVEVSLAEDDKKDPAAEAQPIEKLTGFIRGKE